MKNVVINESISFESTLASPSKPRPNNIAQKPKQIFLVNFVEDNISLSFNKNISDTSPGKKPLRKKRSITNKKTNQNITSIKNNKNVKFHLLDFDALFNNVIIGKKKSKTKKVHKTSHIGRNKNKIKLIGSKRIRLLSNKNTIKIRKYINLLLFIFTIISIESNLKKKKPMHPAGHIGKIRRMTVGGQPYLLGSGTACGRQQKDPVCVYGHRVQGQHGLLLRDT